MATATASSQEPARILIRQVDWAGYESLLHLIGDQHVRVNYFQGNLEIKSPSQGHDRPSRLF